MEGTSLSIGDESTHAVISGHRGLPSSVLFTDLDKVQVGDIFYIEVLGDTHAYNVDQIKTVLPTEIEDTKIEEGQDYVTLVTRTPYSVNTHRLLVRGTRIPYQEAIEKVSEDITVAKVYLPFEIKVLLIAFAILFVGIFMMKWRSRKRGYKIH